MLAEGNLRKLPKYNCRITLDLRNKLTGLFHFTLSELAI